MVIVCLKATNYILSGQIFEQGDIDEYAASNAWNALLDNLGMREQVDRFTRPAEAAGAAGAASGAASASNNTDARGKDEQVW